MSPGEMGSPIAEQIQNSGIDVISPLKNRSKQTRDRAKKYGIIDSDNLENSIFESDLVISILVPDAAKDLAIQVSKFSKKLNKEIYFADLNAVSPETVQSMKDILSDSKVKFIDGGIIGAPPKGNNIPRVYVSGEHSAYFTKLDGLGMKVMDMSGDIGSASAMKMAYASITKGYSSLLIAAITLSIRTNNFHHLMDELEFSQSNVFKDLNNLKSIPSKAHRWIGEMEEISKTFIENNITGDFHKASGSIYRNVSDSKLGKDRLFPSEIELEGEDFFKSIQ
ncbi:MAG: hypothetical protein CL893_02430 [Dehalococcoidia bacterium]|nr:hypothetical protein [Dehalococcoidia bacterium]|tara:strand:+ start:11875 stop:12714 length:840 start_codon:yes stop_codon:yes gene_type:complete